ncbi:hypothetical protein JAB8_29980 [Janthinobacterium sp. HH106]|nr:hypothetical protein JAB8_29980 [Janthinobacterium sp. HH106]
MTRRRKRRQKVESSKKKKYLTEWLRKNYTLLNEHWGYPRRLLGRTGTVAAEQHEFDELGVKLITRLQETMKYKKDMQFAIMKDSQPGAWAIYAPLCYGIVITTGLILNMQTVCGCVVWLMQQSRAQPEGEDNFVAELWRGMPHENDDYESFGGLLAHIAFAFVMHHELAHAGLGHDSIDGEAKVKRSAPNYKADQTKIQVIHESSIAAKANADNQPAQSPVNQALEADADMNGLRYTIQFMEHQATRFENLNVDATDKMGLVWKHMLTNTERRWFAILAGVGIGLYCLISNLDNVKMGELSDQTHPPIPARVMAILVVGSHLYERQNGHKLEGLSNVLLFVAGLLGLSFTVNNKYKTLDDLLDGLRINDGVNRLEEIGAHFGKLAKMRSTLDRRLRLHRRFPDYLCWAWFEDSEFADGTDHIYGLSVVQPK